MIICLELLSMSKSIYSFSRQQSRKNIYQQEISYTVIDIFHDIFMSCKDFILNYFAKNTFYSTCLRIQKCHFIVWLHYKMSFYCFITLSRRLEKYKICNIYYTVDYTRYILSGNWIYTLRFWPLIYSKRNIEQCVGSHNLNEWIIFCWIRWWRFESLLDNNCFFYFVIGWFCVCF